MNYSTDKPIEQCNQDLLGRSSFSKQLGKAIYDYNGKNGIVIGLYGKWGTGKTSVINMAMSEMETLAKKEDKHPIVMRFAPWNYSDKDNLISIFFRSLKSKIELQDNEELKKKVGKALNEYAGAFDALSLVPIVGSGVAAVFKTIAQAQGEALMQGADLEKTKEMLEKALIEANEKIVIIIDDIDRLTNSQIRDVFQLVKQVADFPNVIYVLAMDREVVSRALMDVHNIDGNEYLEKIVQVPFEIPELRKAKLNNIFFSKLDEIIRESPSKIEWNQNYWNLVFDNCIEPYIHTLRDVNRVINTLQFKFAAMHQEASFEDMVGITTIEVLEPKLYKWIANNKEAVCGGFMHSLLSSKGAQVDYRKKYSEEFSQLGINPEKAITFISAMFPVFAKDVKENHYEYFSSSDIRGNMRAANEGRFELYFMFDLDDIKVSRNIINACIFNLNDEELRKCIEEINSRGDIIYFLEEIRALVDMVPDERRALMASAILEMQGDFRGESARSFFTFSACTTAEYLAIDIIKKLNAEKDRFKVILLAVEKVGSNGLETIAQIINRIEAAYGRLASESEKEENQIISLDHLLEIEQAYVAKIHSIAESESLLEVKEFGFIFYLWESFEKKGAKNYIDELFKRDVNKIKFVCAMAEKWNGTDGSGWRFNSHDYSSYVSDEEIFGLIQASGKARLEEFSEIEQIKMASFVLNYGKGEMSHVYEKDARELVGEWEKSIAYY